MVHPVLLVTLASALAANALPSFAQPIDPAHRLLSESPRPGSRIREVVASAKHFPIDKRYHELTEAEKAVLRGAYESMPDGDEPPFPAQGLAPIMKRLVQLQGRTRFEGVVHLHVKVNASGDATEVALVKHSSVEAAKAVAYVLVTTKYKPALCRGTACAMDYPFHMEFEP